MIIRDCTPGDMEDVVALWERSGLTRPWNDARKDFALALNAPNAKVMAGFDGSILVAAVMTGFDGHRGWVYYLAVDPSHQRRGHGRTMMKAAERWLCDRGAPKIQLMVREGNKAALGFYKQLGLERQAVVTLGRRLDGPLL
jgi:ribosomal protein S18 acetylase RimI-like enzyme